MKNSLQKVLETEMSRKEFIQYVGVVLAGLLGITKLLSLIQSTKPQKSAINKVTDDNDSRLYGS